MLFHTDEIMASKNKNGSYATYSWTVSPKTGTVSLALLKESFLKYVTTKKTKLKMYAYALELGKDAGHPHIHVLCTYIKNIRVGNLRLSLEKWWSKELSHPITKNFIGKAGCKVAHSPRYYFESYMQKEGIEFVNSGYDVKSLKQHHTTFRAQIMYLGKSRVPIHKNNFLDLYRYILAETDFPELHPWDGVDINHYINDLTRYLDAHDYQVAYLLDFKKRVWDRILFVHNRDLDFYPDA